MGSLDYIGIPSFNHNYKSMKMNASPRQKLTKERKKKGLALRQKLDSIKSLRFDQFCDAIRTLFGSDIKNSDLKAIYRKISTNPDAKVDWSELFGYFQSSAEDTEEIVVGEDVNIFTVSKRRRVGEAAGDKTRRDTVQCIRYVPSLDTYITASQKGAICMWNNKLRLQGCVDINEPAWVTGCDYLPGIRRAVCCTERSIVIWDNRSKGKNQNVYSIKPFEHSIQCITHVPNHAVSHEDIVLFGDDQGHVNVLRIVAKDLNTKNSKNGEKRQTFSISQNHTIDPEKLTYPIRSRKMHSDWVLSIKYFPELRCFGSCSPNSRKSFVLEEIDRIYDDGDIRSVAIHKGVNCFDYCVKANIIATGGVDKVIRVWHPHIFSRPTGKLVGHLFTIVDICCNEKDQHLISLSTARVFRIWDIHTLTCLQVFTDNEERPGEKRIYSMIFDSKHERLMTGSSVIDAWPLTRAVQDTMQVPHTHDRPISNILLNKDLNQVVTVCTESVIKVWEMETGKRVYTITEAHGQVEVTALCLDSSGYRLASGAYDGSVKVWDFGSGQILKERPGRVSDEDLSIVGMMYCSLSGDRVILVSGWNNKIRMILDATDNYDLPTVREFSDVYYMTQEVSLSTSASTADPFKTDPLPDIGQNSHVSIGSKRMSNMSEAQLTNVFKKDYVLMSNEISCLSNSLPNTLITGCMNGNIILWDIERSLVDKIFHIPDTEGSPSTPNRNRNKQNQERRVHMLKELVHRERKLDPAYLKKLADEQREKEAEMEAVVAAKSQLPSRRVSRTNSRASRHMQPEVSEEKQKELLDQLTARIEGVDNIEHKKEEAVKAEENEEKKDPEKTLDINKDDDDDELEDEPEEDEIDGEMESKYITITYDPVIVSVHQDSFIRFWNMQGDMLREISAITRRTGTPVTALCHDENCNYLITGDQKGYLTLWDVSKFLKNPESSDQGAIKQLMCWRAHLMKVVTLVYVDALKCIISGSADGSARLWWGTKGRFIGFFSQHRNFNWPESEEKAATPVLPYDITERPLAPVKKNKGGSQKIRTVEIEYPLVFDNEKWQPFRRSAYIKNRESHAKAQPEDKKFFGALMKPKRQNKQKIENGLTLAYNHHLESFTPGDRKKGAIYRALPVYRIRTPKRMKTPEASYTISVEEESASFLFGGSTKDQQPAQSNPSNNAGGNKSRRRSTIIKQTSGMSSTSTATGTHVGQGSTTTSNSPRRR